MISQINQELEDQIVAVLKTVHDPEIPVDIYELGLIYEVKITGENEVHIDMTLTSPNCPVAESMPKEVEDKVEKKISSVVNSILIPIYLTIIIWGVTLAPSATGAITVFVMGVRAWIRAALGR
jgi:metal-sulfur cluster biosynthetic enzyme